MTQFGPPPLPPQYVHDDPRRMGPPPWSASAIGAFVLSLLGWIGITAILGLIFGVVGLFATSGGKRRGRGLAIASIPISLATGALAVIFALAILVVVRMADVPKKMEVIFGSDVAAQADGLRKLASADWNQAVSDDALKGWLTDIRTKYGAMTGLKFDVSKGVAVNANEEPELSVNAKFVNGNAVLRFTFDSKDPWSAKLADIHIDGVSPRKPAQPDRAAPVSP